MNFKKLLEINQVAKTLRRDSKYLILDDNTIVSSIYDPMDRTQTQGIHTMAISNPALIEWCQLLKGCVIKGKELFEFSKTNKEVEVVKDDKGELILKGDSGKCISFQKKGKFKSTTITLFFNCSCTECINNSVFEDITDLANEIKDSKGVRVYTKDYVRFRISTKMLKGHAKDSKIKIGIMNVRGPVNFAILAVINKNMTIYSQYLFINF